MRRIVMSKCDKALISNEDQHVGQRALRWACAAETGGMPGKMILFILAVYADDDWSCCVSQQTIAADGQMSERTAGTWLRKLEGRGLISRFRIRGYDGTLGQTRYRLNVESDGDHQPGGGT